MNQMFQYFEATTRFDRSLDLKMGTNVVFPQDGTVHVKEVKGNAFVHQINKHNVFVSSGPTLSDSVANFSGGSVVHPMKDWQLDLVIGIGWNSGILTVFWKWVRAAQRRGFEFTVNGLLATRGLTLRGVLVTGRGKESVQSKIPVCAWGWLVPNPFPPA